MALNLLKIKNKYKVRLLLKFSQNFLDEDLELLLEPFAEMLLIILKCDDTIFEKRTYAAPALDLYKVT